MSRELPDIESLLYEALKLGDPQERQAYLEAACGVGTTLRAEIDSLLRAYESGAEVLKVPTDLLSEPADTLHEDAGDAIGRYKLLEKIGEGGMAVVYMAEQERPVRRRVALKVIKLGMDTKSVVARFEAERQALAMMDHPNIAKVFDAGSTEAGRPYFVMELVRGVSITAYCDQERLRPRERLELFVKVCSAVQHAHQRGIIHRDLKPSNVMVTMHDDEAVPKIIDFGIAKATNQRLTEKTLFTRYAQIIGTPAYMSPEQAQMSDLDIDTRSDIYSLGVLLYELLTGIAPFAEEELRRAGYAEMQRIICEEEPVKPSTKLSTLGETLTEVAKQRCSTPESLRKTIRGDLDWIVMKSLEKNRTRRYETASAFKRDIRRYLKSEPVEARKPSAGYRLQKCLYRHRVRTLVILLAVVFIGAMTTLLARAYRDRQHRAKDRATRILSQSRTSYAKGDRKTALEQVESILQSRHVGPDARLLKASILADTSRGEEAREMLDSLLQEEPAIAGAAHGLLARILRENWVGSTEELEEIESHHRHAKSLLPETAEAYFLRATIALTVKDKLNLLTQALWIDGSHYASHRLRAYIYHASGKYDEMEDDAIAMSAILPQDPLGYSLQAMALGEKGHYAEAITHYDHAIELIPPNDPHVAALHAQRCEVLLEQGEFDRVIRDAEDCLDAWPDETILRFHIFCAQTALGDYKEASSLFKQVTAFDPTARNRFSYWSKGYVLSALEAGRLWHAAETPEGIAFLDMLETEELYAQMSEKARRSIGEGFSPAWSPDGTKLAFSLGVPGFSGLAIYDLLSQETNVLIIPGKDPRWSPDGQTIAFVRDCRTLDLSELALSGSHFQKRHFWDHEVWIIHADGTEPRRLAPGSWPFWSQDSKSVYYSSLGRLCVIGTEEGETQGEVVLPSTSNYPSVSPDGRYATYVDNTSLKIKELSSQSLIEDCNVPPGMRDGQWAPNGQYILLGGLDDPESRTGLWIYDLESRQLTKLLCGPVTGACWSPDETCLAFSLAPPLSEIWMADLEPNVPKTLALDPDQLIARHYQDIIRYCTRAIDADPNHALSYLKRARYHEYLGNSEQATTDVDKYVSIVDPRADMNAHDRWFRDMLVALWKSTPINLGPPINTPEHEMGFVSPDGLALFLESNRSPSHGSFDFWVATRPSVADPWGIPENLGSPINTEYCESIPTISDDNLSLYFTSISSPNGFGPADICVSTRETMDAPWNPPRKLGPTINSGRWQHMGSLSADGLELYLASNRPSLGWNSDYDIWVSRRDARQDDWGVPVNLGPPVNSPYEDLVPIISPDGLMLFFTSERPGGCGTRDIWVSTRSTRESPWREPINPGPPINTVDWDQIAMISTADSMFYFCSWRPGGYGLLDIYKVPIPRLSDYTSKSSDSLNSEE